MSRKFVMFDRMSKSILVLSKYSKNVASARARIYNYKELLGNDGYKLKILSIENRHKESFNYLDKMKRIFLSLITVALVPFFDVLLIHRFIPNKLLLIKLYRKLSRKFIFDYDESYHVDVWGQAIPDKIVLYLNNMIRLCDMTIVSNAYLRDYSITFNKNVEIIPTPIKIEKYPVKNHRQDYPIVIGWIGSGGAQQYLEILTNVFTRLYDKYRENVCLEVVTAPAYKVKLDTPLIIKHIDWNLEHEYKYFQNFDIGIMPLPDNARSRGKASYKALEYMASGLPVVASPIGMNNEVILDGVNGFLPKSLDAWFDVLCMLIESHILRGKIGSKGFDVVRERFSLEECYKKLKRIIEMDVLVSEKGEKSEQ